MSPGPVREALRTLAGEGLVVALPQRGYRVKPLSRAEFDDVYHWRAELDPKAASGAVDRLTDTQLREMGEIFTKWRSALRRRDWDRYQTLDRRFHVIPFEACGSPWLANASTSLWDASVRYQQLANHRRGSRKLLIEEREAMLAAFLARDPDKAADRTLRQIERTIDAIRKLGPEVLE